MKRASLALILLAVAACDDALGVYSLDGGIDEAASDRPLDRTDAETSDSADAASPDADEPFDGAPD